MDSKEIRGLIEAYVDVYYPQENIEEGLRSAIKGLLGGKKKEEAPKPESRGAYLRRKYNVGPEGSDTSAKRKKLARSQALANAAQRQVDIGNASQSYADAASAAHDKYLKAGYSKHGADRPVSGGQGGSGGIGGGHRARRRAAALNREEFEFIVNALIEEGYDLSSYTWDEMYEICVNEIEQLDEAYVDYTKGKLSTGRSPKQTADLRYAQLQARAAKEEGENQDTTSPARSRARKSGPVRREMDSHTGIGGVINRALSPGLGNRAGASPRVAYGEPNTPRHQRARFNRGQSSTYNEEVDLYDIILSHLLDEGYAETPEAAEVLMVNMSEEWREDILDEAITAIASPAPGDRRRSPYTKDTKAVINFARTKTSPGYSNVAGNKERLETPYSKQKSPDMQLKNTKEAFNIFVNTMISEGMNFDNYSWDQLYTIFDNIFEAQRARENPEEYERGEGRRDRAGQSREQQLRGRVMGRMAQMDPDKREKMLAQMRAVGLDV
jgi:hypothetical protein